MARPKRLPPQKREAPIQFRPGSELGQLVGAFARKHSLQLPEACRLLIALAATEMDCRFYPLVHQLALAIDGENAFARACVRIHTALEGARRATGRPMQFDPERSQFIWGTVRDYLAAQGRPIVTDALWFPIEQEQQQQQPEEAKAQESQRHPKIRRKVRQLHEDEPQEQEQLSGTESEGQRPRQPEWPPDEDRPRVRQRTY